MNLQVHRRPHTVTQITPRNGAADKIASANPLMVSPLTHWRVNLPIEMNTPITEMKTVDSGSQILTDNELDEVSGGWPSWRTTLLLIAIGLAFAA